MWYGQCCSRNIEKVDELKNLWHFGVLGKLSQMRVLVDANTFLENLEECQVVSQTGREEKWVEGIFGSWQESGGAGGA